MRYRHIVKELLDALPSDDPEAQHSRRDLRRVNALMLNFHWIEHALASMEAFESVVPIVEIGAGDGALLQWLSHRHPAARFAGNDLIPRPDLLDAEIEWYSGDVFSYPSLLKNSIVVANLFLHHLDGKALSALGTLIGQSRALVCNEPARYRRFHAFAFAGHVLGFNRVTRHDIHASINAGFRGHELFQSLRLNPLRSSVSVSFLGGYRIVCDFRGDPKITT